MPCAPPAPKISLSSMGLDAKFLTCPRRSPAANQVDAAAPSPQVDGVQGRDVDRQHDALLALRTRARSTLMARVTRCGGYTLKSPSRTAPPRDLVARERSASTFRPRLDMSVWPLFPIWRTTPRVCREYCAATIASALVRLESTRNARPRLGVSTSWCACPVEGPLRSPSYCTSFRIWRHRSLTFHFPQPDLPSHAAGQESRKGRGQGG